MHPNEKTGKILKIALDAMGGDYAPQASVEGAALAAKEVFCDMRSLVSKVIRAEEDITLNRGRLQVNAISGRSILFDGTEFYDGFDGLFLPEETN